MELFEKSGNEKALTVELHRPYIDEITMKCPEDVYKRQVLPLSFFMAFVMHASPTVVVWCLNADQIFKCVPAFLESNYGNWIRKLTRDE